MAPGPSCGAAGSELDCLRDDERPSPNGAGDKGVDELDHRAEIFAVWKHSSDLSNSSGPLVGGRR
jgi:hypothetical protein